MIGSAVLAVAGVRAMFGHWWMAGGTLALFGVIGLVLAPVMKHQQMNGPLRQVRLAQPRASQLLKDCESRNENHLSSLSCA